MSGGDTSTKGLRDSDVRPPRKGLLGLPLSPDLRHVAASACQRQRVGRGVPAPRPRFITRGDTGARRLSRTGWPRSQELFQLLLLLRSECLRPRAGALDNGEGQPGRRERGAPTLSHPFC